MVTRSGGGRPPIAPKPTLRALSAADVAGKTAREILAMPRVPKVRRARGRLVRGRRVRPSSKVSGWGQTLRSCSSSSADKKAAARGLARAKSRLRGLNRRRRRACTYYDYSCLIEGLVCRILHNLMFFLFFLI